MAGRFFSFCEGPPNDLAPLQISTSFFFQMRVEESENEQISSFEQDFQWVRFREWETKTN